MSLDEMSVVEIACFVHGEPLGLKLRNLGDLLAINSNQNFCKSETLSPDKTSHNSSSEEGWLFL